MQLTSRLHLLNHFDTQIALYKRLELFRDAIEWMAIDRWIQQSHLIDSFQMPSSWIDIYLRWNNIHSNYANQRSLFLRENETHFTFKFKNNFNMRKISFLNCKSNKCCETFFLRHEIDLHLEIDSTEIVKKLRLEWRCAFITLDVVRDAK